MTPAFLGIDVAKLSLDVALRQGQRVHNRQFENSPKGHHLLAEWMDHHQAGKAHVCLEATGQYGDEVSEYLYQHGYPVSVVNPARIKHYGCSKLRRNKTDKADAQLIAIYCEREDPGLWSPAPGHFKDLQALVRHLDDLQTNRQQQANRMGSGVRTQEVLMQLSGLIAFLDAQIASTKQAIQDIIDSDPGLRKAQQLLVTIPGIGRLTASKLLGEIRDIGEFASARQLAAYAGLTPQVFLSGTSVHKKSRLSKTGNSNLRRILYMPAISAKRWNPIVHQFCSRLSGGGLRPMEVIGAAMRKLLHIVFGVLKHQCPFDPNYLANLQATS